MILEIDKLTRIMLLYIARKHIADNLNINFSSNKYFNEEDIYIKAKSILAKKAGNFVTLDINKKLRACIGQIFPEKVVLESIKENAISAAFNDPRFEPLNEDEFYLINIELSLLSEPKHIIYEDKNDLLNKIKINKDGLIIRKHNKSSTFLPQVWETLKNKKEFLNNLCLKAGLAFDTWEHEKIEVKKYSVEFFNERAMNLVW